MDLTIATQKLAALEALRGQHDQTMRCRVIDIVYGPSTSRQTATERFLEAEIIRLKRAIDTSTVGAADCDWP